MRLSTHLSFYGNCREAFEYYANVLGGQTVTMLSYRESPTADQVAPEWRNKIIHASLIIGDTTLAGTDLQSEKPLNHQGYSVLLDVEGVEKGKRIFDALAQGGVVHMEFQQTFWSPGFGVVTDRFGIPWEVSCT